MTRTQYPFPDWLYGALPFFYLCSGLLTIGVLRNLMAVFSGLTLISAGVVVWIMRYRYRQAFQSSKGQLHVPHFDGAEVVFQTLVPISWRDSFDCGHPVIDAQHRRLFGLANAVVDASSGKSARSKLDLELDLEQLIVHIAEHFCTEEAILARSRNKLFKAHQQQHRELLDKANRMRDRLLSGECDARELIAFVIYDVLTDHVLKEDIKWAACFGQWPVPQDGFPHPQVLDAAAAGKI